MKSVDPIRYTSALPSFSLMSVKTRLVADLTVSFARVVHTRNRRRQITTVAQPLRSPFL